ncbi:MAG: hypothetical protein F7C35_03020 [Desulfurococcales archaeon]|nr:hypothetical protein [Desulfurococcales archaeon]
MGRRRKRRKKIIRKGPRLPAKFFQCPVCGNITLTIDFKKSDDPQWKIAEAKCGSCGLHCVFRVRPNVDRVDVYSMLVDMVYENRLDECRPVSEEEVEKQIEEIIREEAGSVDEGATQEAIGTDEGE